MDWLPPVKDIVFIAASGGSLVVGGLIWRLKGEFATKPDLVALTTRTAAVEREVDQVRVRLDNLPDHEDMADIKTRLVRVEEQINGVREVLVRIERPLNVLFDNHLRVS